MNHNILILSFHFPPSPGVGGRRWAKFVKYLSRHASTNITVVSAANTVKNIRSSYEKDIVNASFDHVALSPRYPIYMQNMEFPRKGLMASIGFRLQRLFVMCFSKGNYFDYTVFWKRYFRHEIAEIISKKKINRIIISGPPFRYAYYSLELKKQFADLEIVYDSRDPWCDVNHPPTISAKRHRFEAQAEQTVLSGVDKILAVSPFQKAVMQQRCKNAAPIFVLRNGFDLEDLPLNLIPKKLAASEIRIAHFGVMHGTKDYYWKPFVKALHKLKSSNNIIFDRLVIEFIGLCPADVLTEFEGTGVKIDARGFLNMAEAYNYLNQADIVLWFKYDGSAGDYATKFGDYISLKKFIWTFSVKGEVTEHIEANKIGKVFYRDEPDLVESIYMELSNVDKPEHHAFNDNYKADGLELSSLTTRLLDILYNPEKITG